MGNIMWQSTQTRGDYMDSHMGDLTYEHGIRDVSPVPSSCHVRCHVISHVINKVDASTKLPSATSGR